MAFSYLVALFNRRQVKFKEDFQPQSTYFSWPLPHLSCTFKIGLSGDKTITERKQITKSFGVLPFCLGQTFDL